MKKLISLTLVLIFIFGIFPVNSYANVQYMNGVTQDMCSASYWAAKRKDADELIMTPKEIADYNQFGVDASGTKLFDLEELSTVTNAKKKTSSLVSGIKSDFYKDYDNGVLKRDYYIDGVKLTKDYFDGIIEAVSTTGYDDEELDAIYGICTKQADTMSLPTDDIIGYTETDPDSEAQLGELKVGDACLIRQKCIYGGALFYYVDYDNLSGWVNSEHIAVCKNREEWLDAWKTDVSGKDFLVVTCDKIITEKSAKVPSTSEVKLTMGCVLKLVPENDIPENIGERNSWNNYTVYLPVRDSDGNYVKQPALISQRCSVSIGFLKMTQRNIAKMAFSCLGNRYGWSGMLDAMDCSLYTRDVYRCFGLKMPRNTTWQQNIPNTKFDISDMTDEQKLAFLEKMPLGALLYFPGHTMIYLGNENGTGYVISDLGSVVQPEGELSVKSAYSVVVNSLNARRKDGTKWITNITCVVLPAHFAGHKTITLAAEPSTFNKAGKTAGVKCSVCGKVITSQKSIPKLASPELTKVTKGKKAFTAKWKKVNGIEGYQIRYSLKKNMKGAKTEKLKKSAVSRKVKKLKAKKVYYVQIRAYTTVNGKKIYSKWSAKKKVKTKS